MARLKGLNATDAHFYMVSHGWHVQESRLNQSVIFIIYVKGGFNAVLFISRSTHEVQEVMQ